MLFKYQVEIDHFVRQGAVLPELHVITDKESFRYVFANSAQQNHIPPHKLHPNRLEQQINTGKVNLTQLLPFELFSKKFCLNISELGLEIV